MEANLIKPRFLHVVFYFIHTKKTHNNALFAYLQILTNHGGWISKLLKTDQAFLHRVKCCLSLNNEILTTGFYVFFFLVFQVLSMTL